MNKKRLENALNAGRLIQLGFSLNYSKPERLNLLYSVNCTNNKVNFNEESASLILGNKQRTQTQHQISCSDSEDESDTEDTNSSISRFQNDDEEKIEILSLQFNKNQNLLATGDSNGEIQIYDIFSGSSITSSNFEDTSSKKSNYEGLFSKHKITSGSSGYNMPTICMKWHPYSNYTVNLLYYAHVNGFIGVLDKQTLKKCIITQEKDEISCIDFSLDGSILASVGKDYQIKLYDSNLNNSSSFNKLVKTYGANNSNGNSILNNLTAAFSSILSTSASSSMSSHSNRLQSVKFSNTSNDLLFTGGWDRTVKLWDKRTSNGYVNTLPGPFICGSDAIDVNDYLVLTASWVKENALELWDIRTCKKVTTLNIADNSYKTETPLPDSSNSLRNKLKLKETNVNEYLYACKFFSSSNQVFKPESDPNKATITTNYSTVLACGSGTQSLHLMDYEQADGKQLLASINCESPLYCLDAIYSCSLIACGGMKKFVTIMGTTS